MLNSRRRNVWIIKELVNLTSHVIHLYDEGGDIVTIEPCKTDIPIANPKTGFILHNKSDFEALGVPYDNVVVVTSTGTGRDPNRPISRLVRAIDNSNVIFSQNNFQ